jgi:hypothetical protein
LRLGGELWSPLAPPKAGKPDFESKQIRPKTAMKSSKLASDFSYPGQQ